MHSLHTAQPLVPLVLLRRLAVPSSTRDMASSIKDTKRWECSVNPFALPVGLVEGRDVMHYAMSRTWPCTRRWLHQVMLLKDLAFLDAVLVLFSLHSLSVMRASCTSTLDCFAAYSFAGQ